MVTKPIAGFLHIIVYAGFVIINVEVMETYRWVVRNIEFLFCGSLYNVLIGSSKSGTPGPACMCSFPYQKKHHQDPSVHMRIDIMATYRCESIFDHRNFIDECILTMNEKRSCFAR